MPLFRSPKESESQLRATAKPRSLEWPINDRKLGFVSRCRSVAWCFFRGSLGFFWRTHFSKNGAAISSLSYSWRCSEIWTVLALERGGVWAGKFDVIGWTAVIPQPTSLGCDGPCRDPLFIVDRVTWARVRSSPISFLAGFNVRRSLCFASRPLPDTKLDTFFPSCIEQCKFRDGVRSRRCISTTPRAPS